jgi:hypothetical protein
LEVTPHSFLVGMTHVSGDGPVCRWWVFLFFFSFFSLFFPENYSLALGCWYFNFIHYFFGF